MIDLWRSVRNMVLVKKPPFSGMRMQPAEALNAATINGAAAMALSADYGSIAPGKVANFFITRPIPSIDFIPYAYTTPIIARTFLAGEEQIF